MKTLTNRLTDIFLTEPENAANAAAFLLLLYILTVLPPAAWMIANLLGRGTTSTQVPAAPLLACSVTMSSCIGRSYDITECVCLTLWFNFSQFSLSDRIYELKQQRMTNLRA